MYKIVCKGQIIDVCENLNPCKFDTRPGIPIRCGRKDIPSGIISDRTGEIYQVEDWPTFAGGYKPAGTVTIVEIEEDEYNDLLLALDTTGTVPDPEDTAVGEAEPDAPKILSRQALTAEVTRLAEQNAILVEQNEMLLGCLLEMSEAVYA